MNEIDLQKIINYQKKQTIETELFFFNKYKNFLANIVYKYLTNKLYFSHFFFEKTDLYTLIWLSIRGALCKFDHTRQTSIVTFLATHAIYYSLSEIRKFTSNAHRVLNAIEISTTNETKHIQQDSSLRDYSYINQDDIYFVSYVDNLVSCIKEKHQRTKIRQLLLMRNNGFSPSEIRAKLKITIPKYNYLMRLVKRSYENLKKRNII